jgi:hypothetical protein
MQGAQIWTYTFRSPSEVVHPLKFLVARSLSFEELTKKSSIQEYRGVKNANDAGTLFAHQVSFIQAEE